MQTIERCALAFILVYSFVEQLEAVTVNPIAHLCPTNKIAPRRKRYDSHPRTFGEFYNLLTPNSPSGLQEKPQQDDSYDCGDIEDYDENDIGSLTQRPIRRQGYQRNYSRKSHSHSHRPSNQHQQLLNQHQQLLNQHNQHGIKPTKKPTRPPQAGYFGTNTYTPPKPLQPSDHVKPVSEDGADPQMIYRPGLVVGAPLMHIVGLPQPQVQDERPEPSPSSKPNHREPRPYANNAYLPASQSNSNGNKHHRSRKFNSDTGILGSFVDLFF